MIGRELEAAGPKRTGGGQRTITPHVHQRVPEQSGGGCSGI